MPRQRRAAPGEVTGGQRQHEQPADQRPVRQHMGADRQHREHRDSRQGEARVKRVLHALVVRPIGRAQATQAQHAEGRTHIQQAADEHAEGLPRMPGLERSTSALISERAPLMLRIPENDRRETRRGDGQRPPRLPRLQARRVPQQHEEEASEDGKDDEVLRQESRTGGEAADGPVEDTIVIERATKAQQHEHGRTHQRPVGQHPRGNADRKKRRQRETERRHLPSRNPVAAPHEAVEEHRRHHA